MPAIFRSVTEQRENFNMRKKTTNAKFFLQTTSYLPFHLNVFCVKEPVLLNPAKVLRGEILLLYVTNHERLNPLQLPLH